MTIHYGPKLIDDPDRLPECNMVYLCSTDVLDDDEKDQGVYYFREPLLNTEAGRNAHKMAKMRPDIRRQRPPTWGGPVIAPWSIQYGECPDFFSQNTFAFDDPKLALYWLHVIGRANIFHLRYAAISVWKNLYDGPAWCRFLDALAREGRQLRRLYVFWDNPSPYEGGQGQTADVGVDINFVRALTEFRGLKTLTLDGFFAKEWPRYLSQNLPTTCVTLCPGDSDEYVGELAGFQAKQNDLEP